MNVITRLLVGLSIVSFSAAVSASLADVESIRSLSNRDLVAALAKLEPMLATPVGADCSVRNIELTLLAGDLYLASSRDGQLKREILPSLAQCESSIASDEMLSRYYKLAAFSATDPEDARAFARRAEEKARTSGNYQALAEALQVKSYILRNLGMAQEGSEALQEGVELAVRHGDSVLLARMYSDYANSRASVGDYANSSKYIEKALLLATDAGATRVAMSIRLHRALSDGRRGELANAESELRTLLDDAVEHGNEGFAAVVLVNIASMLERQGRFVEALEYGELSLEAAREIPSPRLEMNALGNLASSKRGLMRLQEAEQDYRSALLIARDIGSRPVEARLLNQLAQTLFLRGDFLHAYEFSEQSAAMREELAVKSLQLALSESQSRFEVMQARTEAQRLQQELHWEQERSRQQSLMTVLGATTSLLAITLLTIILYRYRHVRQLNRSLSKERQALAHSSSHDPLTGIANRRYLESQLSQWKKQAEEASDAGLMSLLMIDMDNFKCINDDHGHVVGDEVLVEFTRRVRCALREGDIFARWGGDEFCILARVASADESQQLAARILSEIRKVPFVSEGRTSFLSSSIGVITTEASELNETNWSRLVDSADIALYIAKRMGRGRYICLEFTGMPDDVSLKAARDDPFAASLRGLIGIRGAGSANGAC